MAKGRVRNWDMVLAPPAMSPPTKLGLCSSYCAVLMVRRARMRSRKPGAKRSIWRSIASVASSVDPWGTWQYAQPVCFPSGARLMFRPEGLFGLIVSSRPLP